MATPGKFIAKDISAAKIAALEKEKSNLAIQLDEFKKTKTTEIESLKSELNIAKTEKVNLSTQLTGLQAEKAKLKADITNLQNEKIALYNNLETLKSAAPSSAKAEVLEKELNAVKLEKTVFQTQINEYKQKLEEVLNDKQNLVNKIEELKKAGPSVKIEDMADVFKKTLASLQRGVKEPEKPGEAGYIIDKFEVEMKSGLDMREGMKLVQPAAAELKPEGLSTVRISFKARPTLKIAEE